MATPTSPPSQTRSRTHFSNAATPSLSLQLPFILLGRKGINPIHDTGRERHTKRIQVILQALQEFAGELSILLWTPGIFQHDDGKARTLRNIREKEALAKEIEERRKAWEQKERERWVGYEKSYSWILRLTDTESESGLGVFDGWKMGDDLLSEAESKLKGDRIWTCAFLLQRFHVSVNERSRLQDEFEKIFDVFETFNTFNHPEHGHLFRILATQRCHPRLTFHPPLPDPPENHKQEQREWDTHTLANTLLIHTAFERELLLFATPTHLLTYHPLSHFLTRRAIRALRHERRRMWNSFESKKEDAGEKRKRKQWDRALSKWVEELEWEDEKSEGRERVLGEEKRAWWEDVGDLMGKRDGSRVGQVVRDMWRFEAGERRLDVHFVVAPEADEGSAKEAGERHKERDEVAEYDSEQEDKHSNDDLYAIPTPNPNPNETSLPPSPAPSFPSPRVKEIIFPLPQLPPSMSPALLFAHINLLSRLLIFAQAAPHDYVRTKIKDIREMSATLEESPLETLGKLARVVGVEEQDVKVWEEHLGKYWGLGGEEGEDRKRNKVLEGLLSGYGELENEAKSKHDEETQEVQHEKEDQDAFNPLTKHVKPLYEEEKEYMRTFLDRYERAGGFLVPPRTKVYQLMLAQEKWRRGRGGAGLGRWLARFGLDGEDDEK